MAKRTSVCRETNSDSKTGEFTDTKSDARRDVIRNGDSHRSSADAKMLRAWKTISENRGAAKTSRKK